MNYRTISDVSSQKERSDVSISDTSDMCEMSDDTQVLSILSPIYKPQA